jgi:hypothetical protein
VRSLALVLTSLVAGAANASLELQGRDINGNAVAGNDASAVFEYDSVLNITWLRNANVNGLMTWAQANTWATTLTVGGYSGWRLPTVSPVNGSSFNFNFSNNGTTDAGTGATGSGWGNANELGHLFYATLGNKGACTPGAGGSAGCTAQAGAGLVNSGDFKNFQRGVNYWTGMELNTAYALGFGINTGEMNSLDKVTQPSYALAVRSGDVLSVAAVPLPASFPLTAAGLGVLGLVARRRKAVQR